MYIKAKYSIISEFLFLDSFIKNNPMRIEKTKTPKAVIPFNQPIYESVTENHLFKVDYLFYNFFFYLDFSNFLSFHK